MSARSAPPNFEVVAHRTLYFEPRAGGTSTEIRFWIGRPCSTEQDWYCPFELDGWGQRWVDAAYGADSVQALLLAMARLRIRLSALALEHQGRLAFRGQQGPGLPSLIEAMTEDLEEASSDDLEPTP